MKIVAFGPDNRTGAVCADTIVDLCRACAKYLHEREGEPHPREMAEILVPADLARLIAGGSRALDYAQKALAYLFAQAQDQIGLDGHPLVHPATAVRLRAPRPDNARIACAGGNFADHAAAMAARIRRRPYEGDAYQEVRKAGPWGFWKLAREIVGPDGELVYPGRCQRLDYEGEIAIVLGRRGADLKPSQLKDYVWGVTILADWSIRAPREAAGGPLNFALSKNFDTSCALGPCIVVGEADPGDIALETFVNGERRQSFNTREMVFSFGEYLEYLSRDFTLYPGDIISSGTAAGTAADSSAVLPDGSSAPERFLKPGDLVEINAPAIGALRVRVVAKRQ
ncbi:MAG TPA: fumarylacetoacetate hydrolase family protein [Stellaceae bacterium]|jgi:2-keto-4-pentenoate hydratase/2-oxohepta-3-ene-1,7-dioic acid hydratase in catechol pathway|nr:fumarylacetoacetate hydrolase family protein [Stellaceae bacterium]